MKTNIFNLPESNEVEDWVLHINRSIEDIKNTSKFIVDFGDFNRIKTEELVSLACLIEEFNKNNCTISFTGGTVTLNKYLDNINFKRYWQTNFHRDEYTKSNINTIIPLWQISQPMIDSYADYANKFFRNSFLRNKDLIPLSSNLKEVFNNVFDHSNSLNKGYVITQYYTEEKILSFSICDFGIGIPTSVNNYRNKIGKDSLMGNKALEEAISLGFSAKSKIQNRGMGLSNLLESIKALDGSLVIISNNAHFVNNVVNTFCISTRYFFNGSLIVCEIPIDNLDDFDESESIYNF